MARTDDLQRTPVEAAETALAEFGKAYQEWQKMHQEFAKLLKPDTAFLSRMQEMFSLATPKAWPRLGAHVQQESVMLHEQTGQLMLERESLKSQIIALRRELASVRRNEEYLQAQNEKQLEYIGGLTKAIQDVQTALIAKSGQRLCMHEAHTGIVTEVVGEEIAVVFETDNGQLEQIYHRSQLFNNRLLEVGTRITAHVIVSQDVEPPVPTKPQDNENEFPAFRSKRTSGPIEL